MTETEEPTCICPLIDVSTVDGGPEFLRGNPTGSGCPIHETIEMRAALWTAEDRARRDDRRTS